MIYIHNLDPVIFSLGGFAIRWYGLAYLVGILFGFYIIKSLKKDLLSDQQLEQLVQYTIAGILVGGRLGYCLFYNLSFYFYNPIEIFKIWHGGMSFHGGMIGVIIAAFMFTKKEHIALLKLTDLIVFALPCGLFFGRIANFINSELVGRACHANFCVIFPKYDWIPRYPSQLYEACGEGLLLGLFLFLIRDRIHKTGFISATFLVYYAFIRLILEVYREPDLQLGYLMFGLTMGQILSFGMLFAGLYLIARIHKNPNSQYGL
tara:strand:- start:1073 stop:1858 length:786 start_codon:yes stop_codon:yes gene_type:complete